MNLRKIITFSIFLFIVFSCKEKEVIIPEIPLNIVVDAEGNVYETVKIGKQEWMAENLKSAKFCNEDEIFLVEDSAQWSNLSESAAAIYMNDIENEAIYGRLYNWYAVNDIRNICPCGWHVPSDFDWTVLITYIDSLAIPYVHGVQSYTAGGKMKDKSNEYWQDPNAEATNTIGFSGLPGGLRLSNGAFSAIGLNGYWWSTKDSEANTAWSRNLFYDFGYVGRGYSPKNVGFSVRCIKSE